MPLSIAELAAPAIRMLCPKSAYQECRNNPDAIVIDVREPHECQQQPVAGSINIPRGSLEVALPQQVNNPDQPLYLHCASGMRATLAAEQLLRQGYTHVSVIQASVEDLCAMRG
ncbi:MAG: rhodanese-like domain-containing protein [Motiliproteus sp.]